MSELCRRTGSIVVADASDPLDLELGGSIDHLVQAYETYGTLDADGANAILVCHALTGSAHAAGVNDAGRRGWWDGLIGPGRALDTDRYFVVSINVIGSCYGSTGPTTLVPFPTITIRDMVRAQRRVLDAIGVEHLVAAIGGSMGGMQVLEWALLYPRFIDMLIPIATSARNSAWCLGFNAVAREIIELGRESGDVNRGLGLARKLAMLTYRSDREMAERFDRHRDDDAYHVERYLDRHAHALIDRFDAATYLTLTRAMDLHDVTDARDDLESTLASIAQPTLCIGIDSDVRYPTHEQQTLARLIPNGVYRDITSLCGHDSFLIEIDQLGALVGGFLAEVASSRRPAAREGEDQRDVRAKHLPCALL